MKREDNWTSDKVEVHKRQPDREAKTAEQPDDRDFWSNQDDWDSQDDEDVLDDWDDQDNQDALDDWDDQDDQEPLDDWNDQDDQEPLDDWNGQDGWNDLETEADGLVFIDLHADTARKKKKLASGGKSRKRKKKKRKKTSQSHAVRIRNRLLITASVFLALILCFAGGFFLYRGMGYRRLRGQAQSSGPELAGIQEEPLLSGMPQVEAWQDDWVSYQGKVYDYNEDILTFLFMGIDKNDETVQKMSEGTDGGQADALFLLVMNPHDKTVDIIGINRNTMTTIDMYDEQGAFVDTVTAQIATQHGFGNGVEESCEYQMAAVSRLFHQLPIHGYASLNMSAIAKLNDVVGGVDVTVLEDLTKRDPSLVKDSQVHLEGESAFWYVKYRDTSIQGSADARLERQKQYLKGFADAARDAARKDPSVIMDLYQTASPMMVTDISMDEIFYLATEVLDYRITQDSFHMTAGETVEGELFEEFYIDETALYELILEVFYEPVLISG